MGRLQSLFAAWHFAVRFLWLLALLVPSLLLHGAWRLAGRVSPWPRWFLGRAARAAGARIKVTGTPLQHDVLFVANHVSWVDILVLGRLTPARFVAQDQLYHWAVLGWLSTLNNTIFVSRTDRLGVAGQIERVRTAIAGPQPVAIFPEGTTTAGRSLLPFKPALFSALEPPPRPLQVQPVLLDFDAAGSALAWIGTETGGANAWRVLSRSGSFAVNVHFLEPFSADGGRKRVGAAARNAILAALTARHGATPLDTPGGTS